MHLIYNSSDKHINKLLIKESIKKLRIFIWIDKEK